MTVLDKNRRPVTGLTADDFILLEDGKPQVIAALDEISVEGSEQAGAEWLKAPPQDVAANRHDESRLFVLVIDDATLPADPYMVRRARDMARAFIEGIGPTDLAAVVLRSREHSASPTNATRSSAHSQNPSRSAFGASGAEQRVVVPIGTLGPGQYLVSVELTAKGNRLSSGSCPLRSAEDGVLKTVC